MPASVPASVPAIRCVLCDGKILDTRGLSLLPLLNLQHDGEISRERCEMQPPVVPDTPSSVPRYTRQPVLAADIRAVLEPARARRGTLTPGVSTNAETPLVGYANQIRKPEIQSKQGEGRVGSGRSSPPRRSLCLHFEAHTLVIQTRPKGELSASSQARQQRERRTVWD